MLDDRTLIALFRTMDAAERGRNAVIALGIPGGQVSISGEERAGSTSDHVPDDRGFLAALRELFLPDADWSTYEEGSRRGAIMVSANVPARLADAVVAALEGADPIDIDTDATEWRRDGWNDYGRPHDHPEADEPRARRDPERGGRVRSYIRRGPDAGWPGQRTDSTQE